MTGLLGAGESIAGSCIYGAVGRAVRKALDGAPISQVVPGVAGCLEGRTTLKQYKNRTRTTTTPNESSGNRLGGSSSSSRLVQKISQQTDDPVTKETRTWVIPIVDEAEKV